MVEGDDRCRDEYIGYTLQGNVKQILHGRKRISVDKILEAGKSKLRLVLVEGAPGIGKSTYAWELCRKWEEFSCMQQYSLVVLLRLREERVQKVTSVGQLFCSYESEDKDILVKEVLKCQGKDILFIMDGFDELPRALQKESYLLNLIKGEVLPASTVLVTSRPSATAELLTSCRPQKRVEVLGFTQKSIKAYACSIFSDPKELEKFMAYISISKNPAINSLIYVPLNAAIIVQIFKKHGSNSSILPHTLTELYTQLCLTVLNRYLKTNKFSFAVNNLDSLPDTLHKQFLSLTAIAFEGIKKEEVIFRSVSPDLVHFGFLDSVSALYGGGQVSYNFLHLTIQEFLAAYHISQLRGDGLEVFESHGDDKRWNVVWRFVAGLTKFEHFQGHIMEHVNEENDAVLTDHFIQCLFEAQTFTYFHFPPAPTICNCKLSSATPLDMYALGYCISRIPTGMAWEITCCSSQVEYFTKPFMKNPHSANVIKKLHFRCSTFQLCEFKHLPLQEVSVLHLVDFHDSSASVHSSTHISELISNMPSLEDLGLDGYRFAHESDGFLKVLQQLSHSNVTTLNIKHTAILKESNSRHDYISALKSLIDPSLGKLKELGVGDGFNDDGTLACLLSAPFSLRKLYLHLPNLSLSHFEDNSCLTTLGVTVWSDHQKYPVKIVKHNKTLQYMKLGIYLNADPDAYDPPILSAMADALKENSTLQKIEVGCCSDCHISQHEAFTREERLILTNEYLSYRTS